MTYPMPTGGAMIIIDMAYRCLQAMSLTKHVKFGADLTLYV